MVGADGRGVGAAEAHAGVEREALRLERDRGGPYVVGPVAEVVGPGPGGAGRCGGVERACDRLHQFEVVRAFLRQHVRGLRGRGAVGGDEQHLAATLVPGHTELFAEFLLRRYEVVDDDPGVEERVMAEWRGFHQSLPSFGWAVGRGTWVRREG